MTRCLPIAAVLGMLLQCGAAVVADPLSLQASSPLKIQNGELTVIHRPGSESRRLLIHFHGAVETVKQAHQRTESAAVLAVVNFPGLSSAYSKPFAADAKVFDQILRRAWELSRANETERAAADWERVTLSSFSAGYGAVREILKSPESFARVDAIVAADSIYAGLLPDQPGRVVDPSHMQDFLRFARLAADRKKTFVISHSAQTTPYASTTETADHLLHELEVERRPDNSLSAEPLQQTTHAARGGFHVFGYAGETAEDHLQHLRRIDLFWKAAESVMQTIGEPDASATP